MIKSSYFIEDLVKRLEIADRISAGGYILCDIEIAKITEKSVYEIAELKEAWIWRNWLVEPISDGRWRLQRTNINKSYL